MLIKYTNAEITKRKNGGLKHCDDCRAFIEHAIAMDDMCENTIQIINPK